MANSNSHAVMAVITSVRPPFRNNHDKVAFAVHASILASGYVLTATGRPAFADHALVSSLTQGDVGIDGWNEFDGEYAFVYKNLRRSKRILVKCLAMDDKLLVDAIAYGGTEPAHLEIEVGNYVGESREGNYSSQFKNLSKLVTDVESEILDNLDGILKLVSSKTQSSSWESWDWDDIVRSNGEHSYCNRAATSSSSRAEKRKGIATSSTPETSQNRRRVRLLVDDDEKDEDFGGNDVYLRMSNNDHGVGDNDI